MFLNDGSRGISTGVFQRQSIKFSLHRINSLLDRLCLVFVCRGRYELGGLVLLCILGSNLGGVGPDTGLPGGPKKGVRSRPGAARTILLFVPLVIGPLCNVQRESASVRVCCLLVLNPGTSKLQWMRQPRKSERATKRGMGSEILKQSHSTVGLSAAILR